MISQKLINRLKNQDETAFEAVYHETKHAVYAMVISIVRDRFLAEDIMQDTYIKMLRNIQSYKRRYKFINWLLTIAKNTALDSLRANRSTVNLDPGDNDDLFISKDASVEKKMLSEYYLSLIPKDQQQIVLLRVVGDLKHKDIASIMEMPLGTVTYLYQKALSTMRENSKEVDDNA